MMGAAASFHANKAARYALHVSHQLGTAVLLLPLDRARCIDCNQVEGRFADVDADHCYVCHK